MATPPDEKPRLSQQPPRYEPQPPRAPYRPLPSQRPLPTKARKVRGGIKIGSGEVASPGSWAAQRWLRLLEQAGDGQGLVDGLEYARAGQTKRMAVSPGRIDAHVQGREFSPYTVTFTVEAITAEQWEKIVAAMSDEAMYSAKLLSGELPADIEEVFAPQGLKLFPAGPEDVHVQCTCGHAQTRQAADAAPSPAWCKHVCCVGYLLANRLEGEPFLLFALRGIEGHDLIERLRARRAVVGAALGSTAVYQQRVAGVSDVESPPLEESLADFWRMEDKAKSLDIPLEPPAISHPLLRRLGPSPWTGQAQFPLVGLLASCYEAISADALRAEDGQAPPQSPPAPAEDPPPLEGDDL